MLHFVSFRWFAKQLHKRDLGKESSKAAHLMDSSCISFAKAKPLE